MYASQDLSQDLPRDLPRDLPHDLPPNRRYQADRRPHDLDARHPPSRERKATAERVGKAKPARPSIGRRILRSVSRFVIAVLLGVGATLAWQSHGDEAIAIARTWAPSLDVMLPAKPTKSQASASSSGLVQQQAIIARDIAIVRRSLEDLAAKQDQMTLYMRSSSTGPSWMAPMLHPPSPPSASPSRSSPASSGPAFARQP